MARLELTLQTKNATAHREIHVEKLVIAGWTGRDRAMVDHHIEELAALGVKRPAAVPAFYELSPALLTLDPHLYVVGDESSGEAEAVIWVLEDGLWVGLGSDHTDRALETMDVTWSKQVCSKPVGKEIWPLMEVEQHWDRLRLSSTVTAEGTLYQAGDLAGLLHPRDLIRRYGELGHALPPGSVLFCGTLPLKTNIRFSAGLSLMLEDPVLNRRISHQYTCTPLPHERAP